MHVIQFENILIPVKSVQVVSREQTAPPIRQGPGGRSDRQGVRYYRIQSLHKGLGVSRGSELVDGLRYKSSEGLWAHQPYGLYLPPRIQSQTFSDDISGIRDANLRFHTLNSTLGQEKLRFYLFVKDKMYRTVSDTDHSLEVGKAFTDKITGVFEGIANNTRYIFVCTNGTTDDVSGIADPTDTDPSLATIFAYSSGDWVGGGASLPLLGKGYNIWYGKIGGVPGLWYTAHSDPLLTQPKPVVHAATSDIYGNLPEQSLLMPPVGARSGEAFGTSWSNPNNVLVSDNTYASATVGVSTTSGLLVIRYGNGEKVPNSALIRGLELRLERKWGGGGSDIYDHYTSMVVNETPVGIDDEVYPNLWGSSKTTITYGHNRYTWGRRWSKADLLFLEWLLQVRAEGGIQYGIAQVDYSDITVYYQLPGEHAGAAGGSVSSGGSIPMGGWVLGVDPNDHNTIYIVAPEYQDEIESRNVPRILWRCQFQYDPDGDRPVVVLSKVNTGLFHIETACFALGGIVVAGDAESAAQVRLILPNNIVDLAFGQVKGSQSGEYNIVNLMGAGRVLLADVMSDSGMVQTWLYFDGSWHAFSPAVNAGSTPIPHAGNWQAGTELRRRYRVYPSGSNTIIDRTFQPRSFFSDPTVTDTNEIKADGVLTITLPDMDILGPEEAEKVLINLWCFSRDVSNSNTIRVRYSTDGGNTFSTWGTFTSFGSKISLDPPVPFRTLTLEIGLNHQAGSASTPNGLPLLIEGVARWPPQRVWQAELEPMSAEFLSQFPGGVDELWETLSAVGPVGTLQAGTATVRCTWSQYASAYIPGDQPIAVPMEEPPKAKHIIVFEEVVN